MNSFIRAAMTGAGIPGLAAAASRDGTVVHVAGYGLADLAQRRRVTGRTPFHIASITKTVTATAILQLAERRLLRLDDDVSTHLDAPIRHPRHPGSAITFRQLLTHTSGISDKRYYEVDFRQPGADSPLPLDLFLKDYLLPGGRYFSPDGCFGAAPGEAWDYSNVGYGLLGYLAQRVGGLDMRIQTRRTLFAPLGIRHASWSLTGASRQSPATPYDLVDGRLEPVAPVGLPDWPAGNLRASAAELIRFVGAAAAGRLPGLSSEAHQEMFRMVRPAGLPAWLTGQGLGWQESALGGRRLANHWGGDPGVFTAAYVDRAAGTASVVLTNSSVSEPAKVAVKAIAARLLAHADDPERVGS